MVELLVIGLVVIVLVVVARLVWVISHRQEGPSITEAQARENAAPLTTAVQGFNRRARDRQRS